ncbi:MAG TPA: DUF2202 domain-containing protein [Labilithrix sp.]|nr:DUF2202 domain-containing protein [Labilithrix sp.]
MTRIGRMATLALGSVLAVSVAACSSSDEGNGSSGGAVANPPAGPVAAALSADEQQFLRFTREEEKLARDVYGALGAAHPSFSNVASSEQTHMDAVATLLTRYALEDPVLGKATGEFTDATLQKLHVDLVAAGARSQIAALQVGVEIEELDIVDIQRGEAKVTHADIVTTMDNLTRGSRNHLRTFYSNLEAVGGTYTPKHLDQASFDAIVTSARETGGPP